MKGKVKEIVLSVGAVAVGIYALYKNNIKKSNK